MQRTNLPTYRAQIYFSGKGNTIEYFLTNYETARHWDQKNWKTKKLNFPITLNNKELSHIKLLKWDKKD